MLTPLHVELQGSGVLLLHNPALADPKAPVVKQIAAITKKRTKTDEDREQIERLEWFSSLYIEDGEIGVPSSHPRGALVGAARASKQGKLIERGIMIPVTFLPLSFPGSDKVADGTVSLDDLYSNPSYSYRASVVVSGRRTFRVRPRFTDWSLQCTFLIDDGLLDEGEFLSILEIAGIREGIGDNRRNGFGRFTVKALPSKNK